MLTKRAASHRALDVVWRKTSYEYDEWEFTSLEDRRDDALRDVEWWAFAEADL